MIVWLLGRLGKVWKSPGIPGEPRETSANCGLSQNSFLFCFPRKNTSLKQLLWLALVMPQPGNVLETPGNPGEPKGTQGQLWRFCKAVLCFASNGTTDRTHFRVIAWLIRKLGKVLKTPGIPGEPRGTQRPLRCSRRAVFCFVSHAQTFLKQLLSLSMLLPSAWKCAGNPREPRGTQGNPGSIMAHLQSSFVFCFERHNRSDAFSRDCVAHQQAWESAENPGEPRGTQRPLRCSARAVLLFCVPRTNISEAAAFACNGDSISLEMYRIAFHCFFEFIDFGSFPGRWGDLGTYGEPIRHPRGFQVHCYLCLLRLSRTIVLTRSSDFLRHRALTSCRDSPRAVYPRVACAWSNSCLLGFGFAKLWLFCQQAKCSQDVWSSTTPVGALAGAIQCCALLFVQCFPFR